MTKTTRLAAFALSAAVSTIAFADITGNVKLEGDAPEMKEIAMDADQACAAQHADPVVDPTIVVGEKGILKNVIVSIKAADPAALGGEASKDPVVLDQKGCMYEPHVLSMTIGQDLVVKNSDAFLHNVHSLATINPVFNFGQPNVDPGKKVEAPKAAEVFRVKCDVHPWMSAYIGAFEHPFHAVTGEDGKFTIKGTLPDGDYTLMAWHEKLGEKEETITVKDGKAEKDFSFKNESAAADPVEATVKLASLTEKKPGDCPATGACCPSKVKAAVAEGAAKAEAAKAQAAAKPVAPQASAQ